MIPAVENISVESLQFYAKRVSYFKVLPAIAVRNAPSSVSSDYSKFYQLILIGGRTFCHNWQIAPARTRVVHHP